MLNCTYLVIGSGQTGIFLARELSKPNQKVILVENEDLGGSFYQTKELPKNLLYDKSVGYNQGITTFAKNKELLTEFVKKRKLVSTELKNSLKKLTKKLQEDLQSKKIEIIKGKAEFRLENTVEVNSSTQKQIIRFDKCFLAVGKNTLIKPTLKGLEYISFLHSKNIFSFQEVPTKLSILGFSLDNLEIANIYANFGVKVEIFDSRSQKQIFKNYDKDVFLEIERTLLGKKITIQDDKNITEVKKSQQGITLIDSKDKTCSASHLYLSISSKFKGADLKLDGVGINYDSKGIWVDKQNQTNLKNIYAFGDCAQDNNLYNKFFNLRSFLESNFKEFGKPGGFLQKVSPFTKDIIKVKKYKLTNLSIPVFFIGISEEEAIDKFGSSAETKVYSQIYAQGFLKIIYNKSTYNFLGAVATGKYVYHSSLLVRYYQQNLKLKELVSLLESLNIF